MIGKHQLDWVIDQHNTQRRYSEVSIDSEENASHPLPGTLPEGVPQVCVDCNAILFIFPEKR